MMLKIVADSVSCSFQNTKYCFTIFFNGKVHTDKAAKTYTKWYRENICKQFP